MFCCPISDQVMLPQRNLYFYTPSCPRENDSQRKIKEGGPAKKAEGWTSNLEAFILQPPPPPPHYYHHHYPLNLLLTHWGGD